MLIKNTDDTLVNGSMGLIEQFMDIHEYTEWTKKNRGISTTNVKDEEGEAKSEFFSRFLFPICHLFQTN